MALTDKLTAIADAIRGKTGGTEEMTLDRMAAEIAGLTTGGGSSMESGEFLMVANFYNNAIPLELPVTAKHSHILCVPKVMSEHKATYASKYQHAFYTADNYGYIGMSLTAVQEPGVRGTGSSYWQDETQTTFRADFTDSTITVYCENFAAFGRPGATYIWFAW